MKKLRFVTIIMMGMCMWTYSIRTAFCAFISDMFSISEVNTKVA